MLIKNMLKKKFRKIVFRSLLAKNIQLPEDTKFQYDTIKGFRYSQYWKSESKNKVYTAICENVLKFNSPIYFHI